MAFESMVQTMTEMGVLELFFPWLLITALTYGALEKYGEFDESIVGAISLSVGFIALAGIFTFAPRGLFPHFGAAIGFIIFGILGLVMIMGLMGVKFDNLPEQPMKNPVVVGGIALVLISFAGVLALRFGFSLDSLAFDFDFSEDFIMQVLILVFITAIVGIIALA